MMYNGPEADAFAIDITLMVAEQQILTPPPPAELKKREREQLMLTELLKEQDTGLQGSHAHLPHYMLKALEESPS